MSQIRQRIQVAFLLLLAAAPSGCHMMEGLSHDIEDASAYTGEKIAEGGEDMADWIRGLRD